VYSGPISVSGSTTVMAKAFVPGMEDSDIAYATYTISTDAGSDEPPSELELWYSRVAIALFAFVLTMSGVLFYLGSRKTKERKVSWTEV
jgi:hypothetical protein